MAETAQLRIGGKTIELPVVVGSEGDGSWSSARTSDVVSVSRLIRGRAIRRRQPRAPSTEKGDNLYQRRGGRAVECGGLENRCSGFPEPWVRIPPPPPDLLRQR